MIDQRPGDQHDLVVLAEVPDRELLDRLRRQGDDGVADRDDRRGRRPHERGGQLGEPEGDRGGQQAGQGAERVAADPEGRRPGTGRPGRGGGLHRGGHALPSEPAHDPDSLRTTFLRRRPADRGRGPSARLDACRSQPRRASRRRTPPMPTSVRVAVVLMAARGDAAALRRHHLAGPRRARRGVGAPARPLAGRGGALRARQRLALPRRRGGARRRRLVPAAAPRGRAGPAWPRRSCSPG